MKLAILLSGGKDSVYAAYLAAQDHELACAITIESENEESYMFHTPNISVTSLQAEAMEVAHIVVKTKGEKEKELEELDTAIAEAKAKYSIDGVVTGAVASQYQGSRVQRLCDKHDLWCLNPLWQINQMQLLHELQEHGFEAIIISIGAWGLDKSWLGRTMDEHMIRDLANANKKTGIQVAFEGGEAETLVLDCPLFKKKLVVMEAEKHMTSPEAGIYSIKDIKLEKK